MFFCLSQVSTLRVDDNETARIEHVLHLQILLNIGGDAILDYKIERVGIIVIIIIGLV